MCDEVAQVASSVQRSEEKKAPKVFSFQASGKGFIRYLVPEPSIYNALYLLYYFFMPKKTVGFRLDEDLSDILETAMSVEGISASEAVTIAVGQYTASLALRNPDFGDLVAEIAQRRLDRNISDIVTLFGEQVLERLEIRNPE